MLCEKYTSHLWRARQLGCLLTTAQRSSPHQTRTQTHTDTHSQAHTHIYSHPLTLSTVATSC